jgi:hypothetical protein
MGRWVTLTQPQRRKVAQIRREWLRHATATAPADRPAAERAAGRLYALDGRPVPRFVWADSPAGALLAIRQVCTAHREGRGATLLTGLRDRSPLPSAALRYRNIRAGQGRRTALASLGDRGDGHAVLATPPARVRARDRDWLERPYDAARLLPVEPMIHDALADALATRPGGRFLARLPSLRRALADETGGGRGALHTFASQCTAGQFDADGVGADLVYRELGIVTLRPGYNERLNLLAELARVTGPWWPYPDACVMTERPVRFEVGEWPPDTSSNWLVLHSLDGPALAWRDGFAIHAWHGVPVPERFSTGAATGRDWLAEPNAEFRRLIAERIGYARLLGECRARKIASDEYGTLWRIPHPHGDSEDDEDLVVVDVANSTPEPDGSYRRYVLRVPPGQRVPRDAIGWTFGLPPGTYRPTEMT